MKSKAQQEEARLREYLENKEEYDHSIIIASGMLLSVIDHIEKANLVVPYIFSHTLKNAVNDAIDKIHPKGTDIKIAESHNEVALYFDKCIEKFKSKLVESKI